MASHTGPVDVASDESLDEPQEDDHVAADRPLKSDPQEMLNLLRPMDPSGYDPRRACMNGTREAVLNRILTWTQNRDNSEGLMWISGQVGMGKSSLATSLCQKLDKMRALAGCFFCQHDDPDASNPLRLLNNLVHMMALKFPPYAHQVANAIRADRSLCTSYPILRYEGLVKKPLENLKSLSVSRTMVVIVDGLDECGDCESREQVLQMLHDMSQLVPWLKVIITARPTGDLQEYFHNELPNEPIVHLQNYDASPNIRAYIEGPLGRLAEKENWAPDAIDQLCAMSQGNFLWAALATKYIKKSPFPALPRLQKILDNHKSPVADYLGALYTRALKTAIGDNEADIKAAHLLCIGAILATSERDPLTVPDLQNLLLVTGQIDRLTLEQILKNLAPLLFGMNGGRIRFLHTSFRDFVSDSARSGEFHIQPDQCDAHPTASCLKLMQRDLRFNICELETSHLLNSQVSDLHLRIQVNIGPALSYACIHWIDHFISSPTEALVEAIREFWIGPQLMYWIEVLSLLGRLDLAISGLAKLASLELTQFNNWSLLASWAKDIHRFLLSFYDAVSTSTPHLYISALAFAPSESLTAQRIKPHFPNTITIAQGPGSAWHPCVKNIPHPHPVQSLSVSPDGLSVAVGYSDCSLAVWDLQTGSRIGESLVGHRDPVTCVVYSPKGGLVASSSYDATIRVWDVKGDTRTSYILSGHCGPVHAVAFSPDATIIASGSSDKTIRLWDSGSTRCIGGPYAGHSGRLSSLAFSLDGAKLVSGSWDKTIHVWTVIPGGQQLASNPVVITGHSDPVTCVSFSPDGSIIGSGSLDRTIRLWNSQTGNVIRSFTPHSDSVTSIAFSSGSNMDLLVSSSLDGWINFHNMATLETVIHSFGHSHPVNVVAFSPTGPHLVSGSTDSTTRVWDIGACPRLLAMDPLVGHTDAVISVVISSDGARIVSGSFDRTVRMWNAQTGVPEGDAFTGHSDWVFCVAISHDGTRLVSGSNDKTIKLWDTATRSPINSYQHSHAIRTVTFSPNGAQIAFAADDKQLYIWDIAEWKVVKDALQGHTAAVRSVAFSPDGTIVASSDKNVILWDVQAHSRSCKPTLAHPQTVCSIVFSPCGTTLVSGCEDHRVRIWDTSTGDMIRQLKGHSKWIRSVAYSPDGSCIASASGDNTIRLWNTKTGQLMQPPLVEPSKGVRSVTFSPDSKHVISGSYDCKIRVWNRNTPSDANQVAEPPGAFCWPTNPDALSSHPHYPGWVTHDQQSLTFWLPPYYQKPEQFLAPHPEVARPKAFLDYSKFVHGTAWTAVALTRTDSASE